MRWRFPMTFFPPSVDGNKDSIIAFFLPLVNSRHASPEISVAVVPPLVYRRRAILVISLLSSLPPYEDGWVFYQAVTDGNCWVFEQAHRLSFPPSSHQREPNWIRFAMNFTFFALWERLVRTSCISDIMIFDMFLSPPFGRVVVKRGCCIVGVVVVVSQCFCRLTSVVYSLEAKQRHLKA